MFENTAPVQQNEGVLGGAAAAAWGSMCQNTAPVQQNEGAWASCEARGPRSGPEGPEAPRANICIDIYIFRRPNPAKAG